MIQARRAGVCSRCGRVMSTAPSSWDGATRIVACTACGAGDIGSDRAVGGVGPVPDRTARRVSVQPQHVKVLRSDRVDHIGADRVTQVLDGMDHVELVPGRRLTGGADSCAHLAVGPSGVWVIEAQLFRNQRVERRDVGSWFRRSDGLFVGDTDRTDLVEGVRRDVSAVGNVLAEAEPMVTVRGALCLVAGDWALSARPLSLGQVTVCWPGALPRVIARRGELEVDGRRRLARLLAMMLPPR